MARQAWSWPKRRNPSALGMWFALAPQLSQRDEGCLALRFLLAFASAAPEFDSLMIDRAFKEAVVVRTADGLELILRRLGRVGLQQFLQLAFGIFEVGNHFQPAELLAELAEDKIPRGLEASIEENRAQQRFEGIGQGGRALATAAGLFAPAENQMFAQTEPASLLGKRAAIDHLRPGLGQRAFTHHRKFFVEFNREDKLQHGVAEKFQPLIMLYGSALLMRDRGMRQREAQQAFITERITEARLKSAESGHRIRSTNSRLLAGFWHRPGSRVNRLFRFGRRTRRGLSFGGWIQALFQQVCHVALDVIELAEPQIRVGDGEHVAGFRMLVNEDAPALALKLFFDFQNPFALQHHREDETGRAVFQVVLFDEFAQQRFRGLFLDWLRLRGRYFEDALPMRDESFSAGRAAAVPGGPATFADIQPFVTGLLVEQDRVIGPFVRKRLAARLTGVGAGLNVPLDHEDVIRRRESQQNGASEGIRTLDIHLGKVTLYQTELRSLPCKPGKIKPGRVNCKSCFPAGLYSKS